MSGVFSLKVRFGSLDMEVESEISADKFSFQLASVCSVAVIVLFILNSAVAEFRIGLKTAYLRCGSSLKYRILRSPNG